MWYKADGSDGFTTEMKTLIAEPFLTDVECPVFLVMNKDKTEIHFAVSLFGRWIEAFVDGTHYIDAAYVKPVTDPFMIPLCSWKEKAGLKRRVG